MTMDPLLTRWATDVVLAWLGERRAPREAMAALRGALPEQRAAIARLAGGALAGMRRFEFVLAGPRGFGRGHAKRSRGEPAQ